MPRSPTHGPSAVANDVKHLLRIRLRAEQDKERSPAARDLLLAHLDGAMRILLAHEPLTLKRKGKDATA